MYANNLGITKTDKDLIKPKILEAQTILKKLNYDISIVDGIYGNQTFNSIKKFQKDINVYQTGWIDNELIDSLKRSLGLYYYNAALKNQHNNNTTKTIGFYKLSVDQGNAVAQYSLGFMYRVGKGVPQNNKEAARLYKLSADQGNETAQNSLAYMYKYGIDMPINLDEAARLYKLSADQGNKTAKVNLQLLCKSHPSACR